MHADYRKRPLVKGLKSLSVDEFKDMLISMKKAKTSAKWHTIGGDQYYMRSRWEANYAKYLQWLKDQGQIAKWEHEPETFWFDTIKRGCVTYLPDFKVTLNTGRHYWVEVKGYMDKKSATKINRFKKYYPQECLVVVDAEWFKRNNKKMKGLILGWE